MSKGVPSAPAGLYFEAVVAAVDRRSASAGSLAVLARGELKNRTNTFRAGSRLCRGVDELCTKQAEDFAVVSVELQTAEVQICGSNKRC